MSELGTSVIQALGFLRGFFGDVSKLLSVVEEEMTRSDLVSPWGSSAFWGFSYAYTSPSRWIPHSFTRQYVEAPPEGVSLSKVAGWYAFVVAHLTPQPVGQPTLIWGTATLKNAANVWPSLYYLVLAEKGPKFLKQIPVDEWQTLSEPGYDLRELRYQARAVVDFSDETTVHQMVTQPLIELVEKVRAASQAG